MNARSNIYLFSLGHLAVDWAQSALPALLPFFIDNYGLSYKAAAALVFANKLMSSITQPIFGYYSDRVSKPWFVPAGPLLCGISVMLLGLSTSYWGVMFASVLCGFGSSIYHPEAALFVSKIGGSRKGAALSLFSVGGNAGFAVGPIIAGLCAYYFASIHALVIFGIINIIITAILWHEMTNIQNIADNNEKKERAKNQTAAQNDWRSFGVLGLAVLARSMGFTLTNTFLPIYFITIIGVSAQSGANALSFVFTLGVVMTIIGGYLSDKIGCVRVLRITFTVMVPAMFLLSHTNNLYVALLLLIPIAVSLYMPYSSVVILGQTYLAKSAGFASGVTMGLGTTLGGLFAPLLGWIADGYGLLTALQALWMAAIIGVIGAFLLKAAPRTIKN